MQYSTMTNKGQVTLPIDMRRELGIKGGDQVSFTRLQNGMILIPVRKAQLEDLYGFLPKPAKALSIEEMNDVIASKK